MYHLKSHHKVNAWLMPILVGCHIGIVDINSIHFSQLTGAWTRKPLIPDHTQHPMANRSTSNSNTECWYFFLFDFFSNYRLAGFEMLLSGVGVVLFIVELTKAAGHCYIAIAGLAMESSLLLASVLCVIAVCVRKQGKKYAVGINSVFNMYFVIICNDKIYFSYSSFLTESSCLRVGLA